MQKFYQAQSRVWVMTLISGAVVGAHALLSWLVVARLGRGIVGAAIVGNVSWWLMNAAQFVYIVGGSFPEAWTGFSRKAFASLGGFIKLSLASAVMLCVRVANELGAKHPKAVRFSVVVAVITSAAIGLILTLVTLVARKQLPRLFTGDNLLARETTKLGYLLAATISLNSIQPVLSGNLGGDAARHDFADPHSFRDPLQDQMGERGYAGRRAVASLGRKR
ncbi:hypothetical protein ACQ4PT_026076 [Festuca glaucescens]